MPSRLNAWKPSWEGHERGFAYFGGIPREGLYDNATTQVVRPTTGSNKGSAESLVKHVRSRVLVPVPSFADWDELNGHLLNWCEKVKLKHQEKWQTEERALRTLPTGEFSTAQPRPVKISRYALATVAAA